MITLVWLQVYGSTQLWGLDQVSGKHIKVYNREKCPAVPGEILQKWPCNIWDSERSFGWSVRNNISRQVVTASSDCCVYLQHRQAQMDAIYGRNYQPLHGDVWEKILSESRGGYFHAWACREILRWWSLFLRFSNRMGAYFMPHHDLIDFPPLSAEKNWFVPITFSSRDTWT